MSLFPRRYLGRPKIVQLKKHLAGEPKPQQPSIITMHTAKSLFYLEKRGLATFRACNLIIERAIYGEDGRHIPQQSCGA